MTGKDIVVNLATDGTGALTSTAAQVVAAINANPAAAALVTRHDVPQQRRRRRRAGPRQGQPGRLPQRSGDTSQRGPFQQRVYRIGSVRDGSKVGVFLYCQQHAREWTTGLTCVETAERLVRNYATDPQTKKLLDNVEVFILPNVNPDGGHYSMYDFNAQRKQHDQPLPGHGQLRPGRPQHLGRRPQPQQHAVLAVRRLLRRVDELHQRHVTPARRRPPSRRSRTRSGSWTRSRTSSSPTTSTPTAATSCGRRAPTSEPAASPRPAPNIGIEKYFFEAGEKILARIKEHRNTVILPERTGPIADVLYSAAGNSADDQWYRKGIISLLVRDRRGPLHVDPSTGTTADHHRLPALLRGLGTGGGTGVCNTNLINEGRDQAMEFANGNFGMVESAYDYAMDTTAPKTSIEYSRRPDDR